jgi:hypothetical protein
MRGEIRILETNLGQERMPSSSRRASDGSLSMRTPRFSSTRDPAVPLPAMARTEATVRTRPGSWRLSCRLTPTARLRRSWCRAERGSGGEAAGETCRVGASLAPVSAIASTQQRLCSQRSADSSIRCICLWRLWRHSFRGLICKPTETIPFSSSISIWYCLWTYQKTLSFSDIFLDLGAFLFFSFLFFSFNTWGSTSPTYGI